MKYIFPIVVLTVLVLAVSGLSDWAENEEETGVITMPVKENTWFLVGMNTEIPGGLSENSIKIADIKVAWVWDPVAQDYIAGVANGKETGLPQPEGNRGFWILPTKSGLLEFKVDLQTTKDIKLIDNIKLEGGYNFVTIIPSMIGTSFKQLGKNCNILAIYAFNPIAQEWLPLPPEMPGPAEAVGASVVVEVDSPCKLTSEDLTKLEEPSPSALPTPPQIPTKKPVATQQPTEGPEPTEEPAEPTEEPSPSPIITTTPTPIPTCLPGPLLGGQPCSADSDCQSCNCGKISGLCV